MNASNANSIEPEKAGKSGVNNRIYQSFYSISEKIYIARPERMSLLTGPSFTDSAVIV